MFPNTTPYTVHYSIEVVVHFDMTIHFRIVNTGIGWVMISSAKSLDEAMEKAQAAHPYGNLVRHRDDVDLHLPFNYSICNQLGRHDREGREHQYASVLRLFDERFINCVELRSEVDKAIRLAFPVREPVAA